MNASSRRLIAGTLSLGCWTGSAWASPDVRTLIAQGEAELAQGRPEQAVETLQQAVRTAPRSSLAYTRLGGAQLLGQRYDAGIKSFRQAVLLDQGNADAFVGMAIAYLHTGDYALARAALGEAARLAPEKRAEIERVLAWLNDQSVDPRIEP